MRNAYHVKFIEGCGMCKEKKFLVIKNVYKYAKQVFVIMNLTNRHSTEWNYFLVKKRFQVLWSVKKVMLTVFCDIKELIIIAYLEKDACVNSAFCC